MYKNIKNKKKILFQLMNLFFGVHSLIILGMENDYQNNSQIAQFENISHTFLNNTDKFYEIWGNNYENRQKSQIEGLPIEISQMISSMVMQRHPIIPLLTKAFARKLIEKPSEKFYLNRAGDKIIVIQKSPDSDFIYNVVKLIELNSGKTLQTFNEHTRSVRSVTFNKTEDKLITCSEDETAKIWDVYTGTCLKTFIGHRRWVLMAAFNKAEDKIVTATTDADKTAKIWDVNTGRCLQTLWIGDIGTAYFNQQGDKVITWGANKCKIWDVATGQKLYDIGQIHDDFQPNIFNYVGNKVVTARGFRDNTAKVWEVATGNCLHTIRDDSPIRQIVLNHDESKFLTVSQDYILKLWDTETGLLISILDHSIASACFNYTDDKIIARAMNGTIKVFDTNTFECLYVLGPDNLPCWDKKENKWFKDTGSYTIPAKGEEPSLAYKKSINRIYESKFNYQFDKIVTSCNGTISVYDITKLNECLNLVKKGLLLDQALFLECIFEILFHQKQENKFVNLKEFPNLKKHYKNLPEILQTALTPWIKDSDVNNAFQFNNATENQTKKCSNCFATEAKKRCSGCNKVWYCDVDCQRADWLKHQKVCNFKKNKV